MSDKDFYKKPTTIGEMISFVMENAEDDNECISDVRFDAIEKEKELVILISQLRIKPVMTIEERDDIHDSIGEIMSYLSSAPGSRLIIPSYLKGLIDIRARFNMCFFNKIEDQLQNTPVGMGANIGIIPEKDLVDPTALRRIYNDENNVIKVDGKIIGYNDPEDDD